jgi:molybdenum cofactor cytidylyltransferase
VTAGILLAAGQSRRFGGDKQLAKFQGKTLLRRSAESLVESNLWPRVVVLSGHDTIVEQRHRAELEGLDVQVAINPEPERGMSGSVRIGLRAVLNTADAHDVSGVIITVCDQVLCSSEHLRALESVALESGSEIVASGYSEVAGVPAYFARAMFAELEELEGEQGAGTLIRARREGCHVVAFPDGAVDIDTLDDLERCSLLNRRLVSAGPMK